MYTYIFMCVFISLYMYVYIQVSMSLYVYTKKYVLLLYLFGNDIIHDFNR